MRILLLCDRYPNSYRDGLLLRVLHLARRLRQRHRIDLLCYHAGDITGEPPTIFEKIWTTPAPPRHSPRGWLGALAGWDPRHLYPESPEIARLLDTEIDPADYDVVWDAGASLFPQLPARWDKVPVVADLVDDMVLTFWRAVRNTPSLGGKLRNLKYLTINLLFERHCMRRTAHCCVVSEDDARFFSRVSPKVPVSVIQNGVDVDFFTPGDQPTIPGRLVFEGTMAFLPNQEAALYLVQEIMPRIWAERPDATLTLVGRDPPPAIQALASERVKVTGAVEDIRPYVREAEVFVCPLQSGAGIKNKILQAWAMGKAVVATSLSVGGLGAQNDVNIVVRDGATVIAETVLDLLSNPQKRLQLSTNGRAAVIRAFTWETHAESFESLLDSHAREYHPA